MSEIVPSPTPVVFNRAPVSNAQRASHPARRRAPAVPPLPAPPLQAALALDALLATLDELARTVFEQLTLDSGSMTSARLSTDLGVTVSQMKRIERSASREIRKCLRSAGFAWLQGRVRALREQWGDIVPRDHDVTRALLHQTFGGELSPFHQALVVWLAGPYEVKEGWFTFNEKSPQMVARDLLRRAAEGDFQPEDVTTVLDRYGVARALHAPLLEYARTFSPLTGRSARCTAYPESCTIRYDTFAGPPREPRREQSSTSGLVEEPPPRSTIWCC